MIKAAIFDMDGTMVDTEIIQSQSFEAVLSEYGISAEKTIHGTVHIPGMTSAEIWDSLKQKHGFDADTDELTARKRAAAMSVLEQGVEPMPGLLDLLADLRTHAVICAIATSAKRDRTTLICDKLGVTELFSVIISGDDVERVKPAPDAYQMAAQKLGVLPRDCIVFEDTDVGVEAAKLAGMKVVAVPNAYTQNMDFSRADVVVDSLEAVAYDKLARLFTE